jgi:hypothetical protein
MSDTEWTTVAEYADLLSAEVVSRMLSGMGIQNRIYRPPLYRTPTPKYYILVPPESTEEAKTALERSAISDQELTKLALKYPPPDDV